MWKRFCLSVILCVLGVLYTISEPASAVSLVYNKFGVYYSPRIQGGEITDCTNYLYRENLGWNTVFGACSLNRVLVESTSIAASGNDFTFSGKFNIVAQRSINSSSATISGFVNKNYFNLIGGTFAGSGFTTKSTSLQTYITDWEKDGKPMQTFTVSFSITGSGVSGKTGSFRVLFGNTDYAFYYNELITAEPPIYFEPDNQNLQASFSDNLTDGLLQEQINQNNVIINQNTENTQAIYENTRATYENTQELYRQGDVLEEIRDQKNEEKEEIQEASDEGETAANEAGDQAEEDTATITEQMGDIIGVFQTQASDCVIPLNLGHGVDAGNLNMCSQVPITIKNLIGFAATAIVALVVVRLLHTIINTYLEFIESFQR